MSQDGQITVETEYVCSECGHTEQSRGGFYNSEAGQNECPECGAVLN